MTKTYRAKVRFLHDQLGKIEKGQEFQATDVQIKSVLRFAEPVNQPEPEPEPDEKPAKRSKSRR